MTLHDKALVGIITLIHTHSEDRVFGMFTVELLERGKFLDAGRAPGSPEVHENDLAPVIGEADRGRAVSKIEIGRGLADLHWMVTAITAGREDEHGDR
jgi:hypothetical protein